MTSPLSYKPQDPRRVMIFDTSLRDGEQAPGFSLGVPEKLMVAHALKALGVDIIEAGFAAASPGDEAAIAAIADELDGVTLCSLSRGLKSDIDAAARALDKAKRKRCHIFLATSPIHRAAKLRKSRQEVFDIAVDTVSYAAGLFDEVEFTPEDGTRTEPDFLIEVLRAVAERGAKIINIPDTVGYVTPPEIYALFRQVQKDLADFPDLIFSVHCHNDLGLAVANSLSALQAGARQVECTLNGIGERAGNASLEEIVMALHTRPDLYDLKTGIDTTRLAPTSRLLARATGSVVVRNKAIVGKNAFAHESGIHQHGMLTDARTYEIMRPEDVGVEKSNLVLGKHSGRHAIAKQAKALGFELDENDMNEVFAAFKHRADEIGEIDEWELKALMQRSNAHMSGARLLSLSTETRDGKARVEIHLGLDHDDERVITGTGPSALDAALEALLAAYLPGAEVVDCEILQAGFDFTKGAFAEIGLKADNAPSTPVTRGRGRGADPVWAGVRALVDALEKVLASRQFCDMSAASVSAETHTEAEATPSGPAQTEAFHETTR